MQAELQLSKSLQARHLSMLAIACGSDGHKDEKDQVHSMPELRSRGVIHGSVKHGYAGISVGAKRGRATRGE